MSHTHHRDRRIAQRLIRKSDRAVFYDGYAVALAVIDNSAVISYWRGGSNKLYALKETERLPMAKAYTKFETLAQDPSITMEVCAEGVE